MKIAWLRRIVPPMLLLFVLQASIAASPPTSPPTSPPDPISAATGPTVEQIQAKLAALATLRDLPENERTQAQEFYQQAISHLQAVKNYADTLAYYQQLQQSAPSETARLQQSLTSEPPPEPSLKLPTDQLSQQLAQAQANLSDAQKRLADLDQQLTVQQARSKNIPNELDGLKHQATELESKLQAAMPTAAPLLLVQARLLALTTQRQALSQQIAMLEQERLSYDVRYTLLNAQRAVAAQEVAHLQTYIQQLQNLLNARRRDEAAVVVRQTTEATQEAVAKPAVIQAAAAENAAISRQLVELIQNSDNIGDRQARVNEYLAQLTERMRGIRQQLGIAGFSDALGPILLEERRNLPDVRQYRRNAKERQQNIVQARLEQFKTEELLRRARAVEETLKELTTKFDLDWSAAQRQAVIEELRQLLVERQQLLEKLSGGYSNLITGLVALDEAQRKLIEQAELYGALLDRHLLWIRSSPQLGSAWLKALGEALDWLVEPANWWEAWQNLGRGVSNQPELAILGALIFLGLLYYRRSLIRRLGEGVDAIGDVRRDRFGLTGHALAITALLAFPWPWLLGWLAGLLYFSGNAADFSRGLSLGLVTGGFLAVNITFLRQLCRPRGLAMAHFGWSEAGCRLLRRHLNWFQWIGPPGAIIVGLCETQPDTLYGDTLGWATFCISLLAVTVVLWRVFDPRRALLAGLAAGRAGATWRLHYLWYPLIVGIYVLIILLALSGYYYTALQLRGRMVLTGWLLLGAVILINLFLRWLNISQRRLALQRALAKREAQLAARASKDAAPASGEGMPEILSIPDLDLNTINEQTRSLMSLTVLLGLGFGLWEIWSSLIPAFSVLNEITLWHQTVQTTAGTQVADITLGSIVVAGALLVLIGFLARNLPGVLELVVLQRLAVDPGNRNAIITISRYLITAIGLVAALDIIGIGWDQVQWLVAALGLGLGFGMKEIFSNFFSGLILLLERPIRVGDTVTLDNLSGTVSRINIRATTITDWDRKEIIVPNNTFITNSLINWARSDPITRIVIPVGVGYDSDPAQVHEVLLAVASAHPLVVKEPAPAVLFLKFGDSALEFEVRVFVRELANRLLVIHELHTLILQALRANQIEIPFPQRDVHWRGLPDEMPTQPLAPPTPPHDAQTGSRIKLDKPDGT
ncbi:MAG TPA: mechanosensitive ion channel [Candidatus Competibacter sp.]|nr:mechanosensitive ion channel [Candidatus Competibacter sp.]